MRRVLLLLVGLVTAVVFAAAQMGCEGGGDGDDDVTAADGEVKENAGEDGGGGEDCVPDCEGLECGDDGCGGSCGKCYTLEGAPDESLCLPSGLCTECGCGEKLCGLDPCGSTCGTCPGFYMCTEVGTCELDAASCTDKGFIMDSVSAKLKPADDGFSLFFRATHVHGELTKTLLLKVDTRGDMGGPSGPGEYTVHFKDFETGGLWLYATQQKGTDEEVLFAGGSGQIVIESLSAEGGLFKASLDGVVLQEAKVMDGSVVPLPGGQLWCLDGLTLEAQLAVTPSVCDEGQVGPKLGNTIANFQLRSCATGEMVDLYEFCGTVEALWIIATAGW